MKTKISRLVMLPLLAAGLWLCTGCNEQEADAEEVPVFQAPPPAEVQTPDAPTKAEADAAAGTNDVKMVKPAEVPPNLKISPGLAELAKLVQAGVSEEVILTYITNSTQTFNIGADQLVYLNDLGVSSPVLKAAVEHDSQLAPKNHIAPPEAPPQVAVTPPATNPQPAPPANTQPVEAPLTPPAQEVSTASFYTSLAPYGNWVQVEGYGLCWQPTVAVANSYWRPYGDRGHWLWTDAGWYWYSDYSWGWAPFHYGRWCNYPRLGWIWAPDTVWGPSWVTWRYTSDYCGWAPLPPHCYAAGSGLWYSGVSVGVTFGFGFSAASFCYVPFNRFCDPHPYHHYVSGLRAVEIHKQATVVNNITVQNNTIINQGPGRDRVSQLSRREVPTARMVDAPAPTGRLARGERIEGSGSSMTVTRPRIPVEGRVASVPPREEVRRGNGVTGSPGGRRQSAPTSTLADPVANSATVSSPSPQHRGDTKTIPPRNEPKSITSHGTGNAPVAKTDVVEAPPVKSEPPNKQSVSAPRSVSENGASRGKSAEASSRSVGSLGKNVTPLPPRNESVSTIDSTVSRTEPARKSDPPRSVLITKGTSANTEKPAPVISRPGGSTSIVRPQSTQPLNRTENGRTRSIATPPASIASTAPANTTFPGSVRSESARSSTPATTPPSIRSEPARPSYSAPAPAIRSAPPSVSSTPPAVRSAPQSFSAPQPSVRSAPPSYSAPPPAIRSAPQSQPSYSPPVRSEAPSGGGGRGVGNGGGNSGGGGGGGGRGRGRDQ